jgi:hypothetical protein
MSRSGSWERSSMLWELLMSLAESPPRAGRPSLSLFERSGFVRGEAAAEEGWRVEVRGGYMAAGEGRGGRGVGREREEIRAMGCYEGSGIEDGSMPGIRSFSRPSCWGGCDGASRHRVGPLRERSVVEGATDNKARQSWGLWEDKREDSTRGG